MRRFLSIIFLVFAGIPATAQTDMARMLSNNTNLASDGYSVTLTLALSQPVSYRVFTLDSPRRLVIDFPEVDFAFMPTNLPDSVVQVSDLRFGLFSKDKARIILDLTEPFVIETAEFIDNILTITLARSDASTFAASVGTPPAPRQSLARPIIEGNSGLPLVALDAGHGGVDPGAIRGKIKEKQVTLLFALQLRDALLQTGRYRVLMTRVDDTFLTLPERIRLARASHADIFLSIHANTVARGNARGTTVYNLSEEASNEEAATRAIVENRSDIVAGAVLLGQDDQIANILIDLAQRETNSRSVLFADILASTIRFTLDKGVRSRRLAANFRVLRAVDTPSVLIELGFMSNNTDLAKLMSVIWRNTANQAIIAALDEWIILSE